MRLYRRQHSPLKPFSLTEKQGKSFWTCGADVWFLPDVTNNCGFSIPITVTNLGSRRHSLKSPKRDLLGLRILCFCSPCGTRQSIIEQTEENSFYTHRTVSEHAETREKLIWRWNKLLEFQIQPWRIENFRMTQVNVWQHFFLSIEVKITKYLLLRTIRYVWESKLTPRKVKARKVGSLIASNYCTSLKVLTIM